MCEETCEGDASREDNASWNMSKKRATPLAPAQLKSKGQKDKEKILCPVCDECIVDATDGKPGQDSIFCDSTCQAWLHRKCAGLSKSIFNELSKSTKPYQCTHCKLNVLQSEVCSLKDLVKNLSSHLSMVMDELTSLKEQVECKRSQIEELQAQPSSQLQLTGSESGRQNKPKMESQSPPMNYTDRKMNLVLFGIDECDEGTRRHMRVRRDFERAGSVLSQIEPAVTEVNIRECYRLGKFKVGNTRPLLLKLSRLVDVTSILSGRHKLSASPKVRIKPDLTPKERKVEQLLLMERRSLITSGKERKSIKLRGSSLYVDNRKYGEVKNNKFEACERQITTTESLTTAQLPDLSPAMSSTLRAGRLDTVGNQPPSPPTQEPISSQ